MTTEKTDRPTIETIVFNNRPPLRMAVSSQELLESWRGGSYGLEGGSIQSCPSKNGGWHVWANSWSNVDPCWDRNTYGGIAGDYDSALTVLQDLAGGDAERIGEALIALADLGVIDIEQA